MRRIMLELKMLMDGHSSNKPNHISKLLNKCDITKTTMTDQTQKVMLITMVTLVLLEIRRMQLVITDACMNIAIALYL